MSFETINDHKDLNSHTSRFQRSLDGINYNLSRLPSGPAANLDRLPASVSERLDPRMPLSHHLHRPFRTADIPEKPTDTRQGLEMNRAKLRVNHRDFLSHNLAVAKGRMDNDLASAISHHLTDLDVKSWEENMAYNPQRTPPRKTASQISRSRGGNSINRSTSKRQVKQSAGVSHKPSAITSHLQRRRNILCMATKLSASYKRASAKTERLRRARLQMRKRAFMALYIGLNALAFLALAGMRQRDYAGKLCEVGEWKWNRAAVGYRFAGWMYKC